MLSLKYIPIVFLFMGSLLNAASSTTTFTVSATVINSCNINATNLIFGDYNPLSATATDGTSTITATCVLGGTYTIALDVGGGAGASFSTGRKMTSLTDANATLTYNLYSDPAHTTVWGDNTDGSFKVSGTGAGPVTAIPHTVYGRIPANENVSIQSYQDTITATINY